MPARSLEGWLAPGETITHTYSAGSDQSVYNLQQLLLSGDDDDDDDGH